MEFVDRTAIESEIHELRRQVAVAESTKKIMQTLGLNEWQAGRMAQYLNGASDVDALLSEVQRLFAQKERKLSAALRASASGRGGNNPASVTQEEFSRMSYLERVRLYDEDQERYERLLGR